MPKSRKNRPEKNLKPVLRIYCEGAKTEPNYIQGYLDKFFNANRRLKLVKIADTNKNTPNQLVDEAVNAKQQSNKDGLADSYWVVYDRESEHKYPEKLHDAAYKKAQKNDISVALSNVCFEVWLLLHFRESAASYSCFDDLRNQSFLREECRKRGITDYDKGEKGIFNIFSDLEIQQARNRAQTMNEQILQCADSSKTFPYQLNPYTDVYSLLDKIDEIAKEN
jgi:RloB-like protein